MASAGSEGHPPLVAEVVRNGFVESSHRGSVAVTAPGGGVEWSIGDVAQPTFPRSSNKPMQALGMLRVGLRLDGALLALAAGSHCGERIHLDGVREILAGAGVDESLLQNPRARPADSRARKAWIRDRTGKAAIAMACSGKHAAMLATCVANDWPTDSYCRPDHPLQRAIAAAVEDSAGEPVAAVAVDGCGAPALAISLAGLARAFGRFASADPRSPEGRVVAAYRHHPEYVSGTRRLSPALMRSVPGLFCKTGAEGVFAVGLPDGRGIAVKIDDGSARARLPVVAATLQRLGVDNEVIRALREDPVLGGGVAVGAVRPSRVFGQPG